MLSISLFSVPRLLCSTGVLTELLKKLSLLLSLRLESPFLLSESEGDAVNSIVEESVLSGMLFWLLLIALLLFLSLFLSPCQRDVLSDPLVCVCVKSAVESHVFLFCSGRSENLLSEDDE